MARVASRASSPHRGRGVLNVVSWRVKWRARVALLAASGGDVRRAYAESIGEKCAAAPQQ